MNGLKRKDFHSLESLTAEQRKEYNEDKARYEKEYPYLKEAVAQDILHEALLIKARLAILTEKTLDPNADLKTLISANKLVNDLQRTLQIMFQRLGLTYQAKRRRKERQRKSPIIQEGDDNESA